MVRTKIPKYKPLSENSHGTCPETELEEKPLDPIVVADRLVEKSIKKIREELGL
jgi:hypothetical protein